MVSVKFNVFSLKMFYVPTKFIFSSNIFFQLNSLLHFYAKYKVFFSFCRHLCNRIPFFKVENINFSRYKFLEGKYNHIALITCRIL